MKYVRGGLGRQNYMVCDADGNSAVIEFVDGKIEEKNKTRRIN